MNFLLNQIREQKILEMEVDLENFIQDNNISENALVFRLEFDKDVFVDLKEVKEYLKDKYFWATTIEEKGNKFVAILNSPSQMDSDTEIKVELRRGVVATAANLLPVMTFEEMRFNEKGEINLSSKFSGELNLSEGLPHIIEIARVAEGEHPSYGKLKITAEDLKSMETNYKAKVVGVDLAVNEDHKKNEAFGWFKDVFLSYDGSILYGQVFWNAKGTTALSEKEYRYFSPEFRFNYIHPHTGVEHGPTLLGGALTNYPFLKMDAITQLNVKNELQEGDLVSKETQIDLSIHNEKIVELNNKITEVNGELNSTKAKNIELSSKVTELEAKIQKANQEKVHEKLFADGKISKAQLVALNEGKSMLEVLSLNDKLHTEATGADSNPGTTISLSEKEKKVADSLGLTAEEFVQYNK